MQSSGLAGTAAMCVREENTNRAAHKATLLGALLAAAALTLILTGRAGAQDAMAEPTPTPAPASESTTAAADNTVSTLPNPDLPPSDVPVADNAIQLSLDDA
ncbi:MAG TPA: hypothetical protein VN811_08495, partial [Thermoanaerobaculia bacterium]|nr:hypothetical protein [Thermoanaerobaculia bacterium]